MNFLRLFPCWDWLPVFFFHGRIVVVQEFGSMERKIRCTRCNKYFVMNDRACGISPWDDDMEDLYANVMGFGKTYK